MGSIEVFSNSIYFYITSSSLLLFFLTLFYTSYDNKPINGLWTFFWGVFFEAIAFTFGYNISAYHNSNLFEIMIFAELGLWLLSLLFLSLSATTILFNNKATSKYIWITFAVLLIFTAFFIFIRPNGDMVNKIRMVFPLIGFGYVASAFWSKSNRGAGYKMAALVSSMIAITFVFKIINQETIVSGLWYLPSTAYVLFAISTLMIKSDSLVYHLKTSTAKIKEHSSQIENIIKMSPFPIIISRLSDDKLIVANDNAGKLFGIKQQELNRYRLRDFFLDQENRHLLNEKLEEKKEVKDFEILVKTATGNTPFWLLTSANIIDYNKDIGIYLAFQDITSRKNKETMLKNQANRDPLTSLYNRRYFETEVEKRIDRSGPPFSILMIDIDKFKSVNDTYGHKIGDKVLIEIAGLSVNALRDNDIVARYGGEEFIIYLHNTDEETSILVAERLRETIATTPIQITEDKAINITTSIGIATSQLSSNVDELAKLADIALYRAKNNGRNRCEIFHKDDDQTIVRKKSSNVHPAFEKEEAKEVSLLDGVETNHIISTDTNIEEVYNIKNEEE